MLKLNASYSKKVPVEGQEYSSQSFHCSVEVEIPDGLSPDDLQARIHSTFSLVRDSVDAELHSGPSAHLSGPPRAVMPIERNQPAGNGGNGCSGAPQGAGASGKQIKFLTDLALRKQMDLRGLDDEANRLFGVGLDGLTRKQASEMIDMLNGGGRGSRQRRAA
ncbi:MAG: hypothetical protein HN742_25990 [Lentisphaerae bacterium]|jgi:hypothetical protein|nr:hypothetical protein [Lentisphaerota bacterium]MBT7056861.1 hypothetical protein [Lentisphaerota bacterium]MBT7845352.1 hypothetical protein [Lentisphaerota bacterium]